MKQSLTKLLQTGILQIDKKIQKELFENIEKEIKTYLNTFYTLKYQTDTKELILELAEDKKFYSQAKYEEVLSQITKFNFKLLNPSSQNKISIIDDKIINNKLINSTYQNIDKIYKKQFLDGAINAANMTLYTRLTYMLNQNNIWNFGKFIDNNFLDEKVLKEIELIKKVIDSKTDIKHTPKLSNLKMIFTNIDNQTISLIPLPSGGLINVLNKYINEYIDKEDSLLRRKTATYLNGIASSKRVNLSQKIGIVDKVLNFEFVPKSDWILYLYDTDKFEELTTKLMKKFEYSNFKLLKKYFEITKQQIIGEQFKEYFEKLQLKIMFEYVKFLKNIFNDKNIYSLKDEFQYKLVAEFIIVFFENKSVLYNREMIKDELSTKLRRFK